MKKILLFVAIVFATITANSQFLKLGVKAGTNVSKIGGASFKDKFEYGYHLGAFAQVKLSPKFTLQPELMLSQINTTVDSNFHNLYNSVTNNNYLKSINLKYITIPLVLNYNLNSVMALQGGVQYGRLMNKDSSLLQNGQQAFKNGDLAALAGVQFKLGKLLLSGRYIIGVSNINDIDNKDLWKNQTAQISLGFRF